MGVGASKASAKGIIHFIWAGGVKPMPEESLARVKKWKLLNPEAEIWLWVDSESLPKAVKDYYESIALPEGGALVLQDIRNLVPMINAYKVDGAEFNLVLKKVFTLAVYEFKRLRINYGASSDLLRYLILFLCVGINKTVWAAYFDHDVESGSKPIRSVFSESKETLFFPSHSQTTNYSGNDAFICSAAYHPLLKGILEGVLDNYAKKYLPEDIRMEVYGSDMDDHDSEVFLTNKIKVKSTIRRSGPVAIVRALFKLYQSGALSTWNDDCFEPPTEECLGFIPPRASLIPEAVCPGNSNVAFWGRFPLQPMFSLERAIDEAVEAIRVEADIIGLIRLDDHVQDIVDTLNEGLKERERLRERPIAEIAAYVSETAEGLCLPSTSRGAPTEFERAIVAPRLVAKLRESLKPGELACIFERQLISRYSVIRDYYDEKLSNVFDCADRVGIQANRIFVQLMDFDAKKPSSWERGFNLEELQAITDHWFLALERFLRREISTLSKEAKDPSTQARVYCLSNHIQSLLVEVIPKLKEYEIRLPLSEEALLEYQHQLNALYKSDSVVVVGAAASGGAAGSTAAGGAGDRGGAMLGAYTHRT